MKIDAQKLAESMVSVSSISSHKTQQSMLSAARLIDSISNGDKVQEAEVDSAISSLKESSKYSSHVKACYLIDLGIEVLEMSKTESIENWRIPEPKPKRKAA